ncbi:glutamyl-Q tRNA(Asp) synthetase [Sideroxyarcus emersonii]|uniref:Glutamyl-Q tRNA(Asp) synthetase n=1 Tax=Sideroxyarcus emersonii TaxID=2764705 RepID=A0AAN1X9A2_9PROT|nr:tRNA glutamyl-Q(34) synthetase GluQRS [Sideroxyarcus emersonii]BCK87133.1 glutamyl-Q tRNA(Asp) synthetase [Sideroxyarcus emersonii]
MKRKPSLPDSGYRGRFAPSPTGPLHFGSLVAAVGSFLDAKHHHGTWLVRMEDLDAPRCMPGVAEDILRTLDAFGLHSDEPILHQSQRTTAYAEALRKLQVGDAVYPCCCTRKEIADSALHGIDGPVYPGTCRKGIPAGREGRAWRVRTNDKPVEFDDALQGRISQRLESEVGDFVVKRADGLFAYQLAVVVDDAFQGITHIVRGADLLDSTPRQIHLQRLLELPRPRYMHLPVAVDKAGEKLSKQTLAAPVDESHPARTLLRVLDFLQQYPPESLATSDVRTILDWAIRYWNPARLQGITMLPVSA